MNQDDTGAGKDWKKQGHLKKYSGKVRDVYHLDGDKLLVVATDRISAFDRILDRMIPGKGVVLNLTASYFLDKASEVCPVWLEKVPHARVSYGVACQPIAIEMVVRGYLCGHALRVYQSGKRSLCGEVLAEGLKPYQKLQNPIITPSTKASEGHDEDISKVEIISSGLTPQNLYEKLEKYSLALYAQGVALASQKGLILADTKYEFGLDKDGEVVLIDEVHTPDSSRYYELEGYEENVENGIEPVQLSKEFVRQWLISNGFQGKEGQEQPTMSQSFVNEVQTKYIALYQRLTGNKMPPKEEWDLGEEYLTQWGWIQNPE